MEKKQSVFHTLSALNVKDKVRKKNNLSYVSWSDAWAMLKKLYPTAQRTIYEHEHTGFCYFTDGNTAWVKVGITVENIEHIDMLPIMDFRNRSITVDSITSMDVNKAIQRATVKAIAMHGLGLAVYQGEDLEDVAPPAPKPKPKADGREKLTTKGDKWVAAVKYFTTNAQTDIDDLFKFVEKSYDVPPRVKAKLKEVHAQAQTNG
jgi:hypothetical protein